MEFNKKNLDVPLNSEAGNWYLSHLAEFKRADICHNFVGIPKVEEIRVPTTI